MNAPSPLLSFMQEPLLRLCSAAPAAFAILSVSDGSCGSATGPLSWPDQSYDLSPSTLQRALIFDVDIALREVARVSPEHAVSLG